MNETKQFRYKDMMDLNFELESPDDKVFEDIHGYSFFILQKDLSPGIYLEWEPESRKCILVRLKNSLTGEKAKTIEMNSLREIKNFISLFSNK